MTSRLRNFAIFALAISAIEAIGLLTDTWNNLWTQFSPSTVFKLSINEYYGLFLTILASLFAWFSAITIGVILGYLSTLTLNEEKTNKSNFLSISLNQVYDSIYIIPLVLTLSFFYALFTSHIMFSYGRTIVAVLMLAATGACLGGYHVYRAIYVSVKDAKKENRYLMKSLLFSELYESNHLIRMIRKVGILNSVYKKFIFVKKLCGFELPLFYEAVTKSLYLSIVSVIILESIIPNFYELLLPQSAVAPDYLGGVGKLVIVAQNKTAYQTISGFIWNILFFSWFLNLVIEKSIDIIWRKYY